MNTFFPQPLLEKVDIEDYFPLTLEALHKSLLNSNGLFFIHYTPQVALKCRWFLAQINHDEIK